MNVIQGVPKERFALRGAGRSLIGTMSFGDVVTIDRVFCAQEFYM